MIGRNIQNYKIEELLGEGGMGTVYRAVDVQLNRTVALKSLHQHLVRDTTFLERFRNEAMLLAKLNHPNIATLYNLLKDRQDSYMVMEFVDGHTLENLIKRHSQIPFDTAIKIIIQTLDGLSHAHQKGILHRDIKPANVMLTRDGSVKLMDFGIARMVGSQRMTQINKVVGTLEYMAPELLNGEEPSEQSDLYAIGILLFELITGKVPYQATTDSTLINQILNKKPISIKSFRSDIPSGVGLILEKVLAKKPEKRHHSAAELRHELSLIVPAGAIKTLTTQTQPKKIIISPTSQQQRPAVAPTRLVTEEDDKKVGFWKKIKTDSLSIEAIILISSILVAVGVLTFGLLPASKLEIVVNKPKNILKIETPKINQLTRDSLIPTEKKEQLAAIIQKQEPQNKIEYPTIPPKPINKKPVNKPTEKGKPIAVVPPEKIIQEPEEKEKIPEPKPEPKKEVEAPLKSYVFDIKNEQFSIEFVETITSDDTQKEGGTIWLKTTSPIVIDNETIVSNHARVRGRVIAAKSSTNSNRALLSVRFESVETVDGQWIPIRFPEYSDKSSSIVEFRRGRQVSGLKTGRIQLTIKR